MTRRGNKLQFYDLFIHITCDSEHSAMLARELCEVAGTTE